MKIKNYFSNMELKNIDQLKEQGLTKSLIQQQANEVGQLVENGDISTLDVLLFKSYLENLAKSLDVSRATDELDTYGEKEITYKGVKLTKKEAGVRLDYSNTEIWQQAKSYENEAAEVRKDIEARLKVLKKPVEELQGEELITLNPPIRTSKTVVAVSIPKG